MKTSPSSAARPVVHRTPATNKGRNLAPCSEVEFLCGGVDGAGDRLISEATDDLAGGTLEGAVAVRELVEVETGEIGVQARDGGGPCTGAAGLRSIDGSAWAAVLKQIL